MIAIGGGENWRSFKAVFRCSPRQCGSESRYVVHDSFRERRFPLMTSNEVVDDTWRCRLQVETASWYGHGAQTVGGREVRSEKRLSVIF